MSSPVGIDLSGKCVKKPAKQQREKKWDRMTINQQIINRTLPSGAPKWVTPELLTETREVWQPYYAAELTDADLSELLLSVSRLFAALQKHVLPEKKS